VDKIMCVPVFFFPKEWWDDRMCTLSSRLPHKMEINTFM
jgi:hypothetical protein